MYDKDIRQMLRGSTLQPAINDPDTLVVEEMGIYRGTVFVDMATLHSDCWTGYEIKSSHDSLKRLTMQSMMYGYIFDRMWLVCDARHTHKASHIIPEWWGIMHATRKGLKIDREAGQNGHRLARYVADMMWAPEARQAAIDLGVDRGVRSKPKGTILTRLVNTQSIDTLRRVATQAMKSRERWKVAS